MLFDQIIAIIVHSYLQNKYTCSTKTQFVTLTNNDKKFENIVEAN